MRSKDCLEKLHKSGRAKTYFVGNRMADPAAYAGICHILIVRSIFLSKSKAPSGVHQKLARKSFFMIATALRILTT